MTTLDAAAAEPAQIPVHSEAAQLMLKIALRDERSIAKA
jgi:hypothetical protein